MIGASVTTFLAFVLENDMGIFLKTNQEVQFSALRLSQGFSPGLICAPTQVGGEKCVDFTSQQEVIKAFLR